eukprot:6187460-Pleurochrysis_carterae.AAC.4
MSAQAGPSEFRVGSLKRKYIKTVSLPSHADGTLMMQSPGVYRVAETRGALAIACADVCCPRGAGGGLE